MPLDTQPNLMHGLRLPGVEVHWQLPVGPEVVSSCWQPGSAGDSLSFDFRLPAEAKGPVESLPWSRCDI